MLRNDDSKICICKTVTVNIFSQPNDMFIESVLITEGSPPGHWDMCVLRRDSNK